MSAKSELKEAMLRSDGAAVDWGKVAGQIRQGATPADILSEVNRAAKYQTVCSRGKADYATALVAQKRERDPAFSALLQEKGLFSPEH